MARSMYTRDEIMRKIREKASSAGLSMSDAEVGVAYREILDRNRAAVSSWDEKFDAGDYEYTSSNERPVEIVDVEGGGVKPVLDPITGAATSFASGATGGLSRKLGGVFAETPDEHDYLSKGTSAASELLGMMRVVGPVAKYLGAGPQAGAAQNIFANAAAGAGYGGVASAVEHGLDPAEIAKGAARDGALFGAIAGLPAGIVGAANKALGPTAGAVASNVLGSVPGKMAYDTALFTGMDYAFHPESTAADRIARIAGGVGAATAGSAAEWGRAAAKQEMMNLREAALRAKEAQAAREREVAAAERRAANDAEMAKITEAQAKAEAERLAADQAYVERAVAETERIDNSRRARGQRDQRAMDAANEAARKAELNPTVDPVEQMQFDRPQRTTGEYTPVEVVEQSTNYGPDYTGKSYEVRQDPSRQPGGDIYLGAGFGALQPTFEAVGRGVSKAASEARRRGGMVVADVAERVTRPVSGELYDAIAEGRGTVQPVDGMPVTNVLVDRIYGRITDRELVDWVRANRDQVPGAIGGTAMDTARRQLEAEGVKNPTDAAVRQRALADSAPADVRAAVDAGEVQGIGASVFLDKRRTTQAIDNGNFDGPITRATQRLGEIAERVDVVIARDAAAKIGDVYGRYGIVKGSPEARAVTEITLAMEGNPGSTPQSVSGVKSVRDALDKVGDPQSVMDAAFERAAILKDMHGTLSTVRESLTGNPLGEVEGAYVPHRRRRVSPRESIVEWAKRVSEPTAPPNAADRARYEPGEYLSSAKKRRTGELKPEEMEKDIVKLDENYANEYSSMIAKDITLASVKSVSAYMDKASTDLRRRATEAEQSGDPAEAKRLRKQADDMNTSAETLDAINQLAYNDIQFGAVGAVQRAAMGTRLGTVAYKSAALNKQLFNRVRYTYNIPFIVLRQWTSLGLLGAFPEVTAKDFAKAWAMSFNPKSGEILDATYTGFAKGLDMGSMYNEGSNGGLSRGVKIGKSGTEKVLSGADRGLNWLTGGVERATGRFSVAMGEIIAKKIGLTGREAQAFTSDLVAKTQSEYHSTSRASILRDPLINFAVPAQSYSLEGFNLGREVMSDKVGGRWYGTGRDKAFAMTRMGLGVFAANLGYQVVNRKRELDDPMFWVNALGEDVLSLAPFSGPFTGMGPAQGNIYPLSQYKAARDVGAAVAGGDYEKAAQKFAGSFFPVAGGQVSRVMSADIMYKRGVISADEVDQAKLFGWWTTRSGREYLRRFGASEPSGGSAAFGPDDYPAGSGRPGGSNRPRGSNRPSGSNRPRGGRGRG